MYKNGFKALEDEIRAAIKAKGIENNIVLHINSYRYYISICPDQKSDNYKFIKNYNNFLFLQKKRKVDKKKREISKDFRND